MVELCAIYFTKPRMLGLHIIVLCILYGVPFILPGGGCLECMTVLYEVPFIVPGTGCLIYDIVLWIFVLCDIYLSQTMLYTVYDIILSILTITCFFVIGSEAEDKHLVLSISNNIGMTRHEFSVSWCTASIWHVRYMYCWLFSTVCAFVGETCFLLIEHCNICTQVDPRFSLQIHNNSFLKIWTALDLVKWSTNKQLQHIAVIVQAHGWARAHSAFWLVYCCNWLCMLEYDVLLTVFDGQVPLQEIIT